jgi:septal ring factor EnvC (AmiA/AmiB activator)
MQPDLIPEQEEQQQPVMPATPAPTPKSPKKSNLLTIVLGIALLFSGLALAAVGVWAFQLNTDLQSTQAALTSLQGQYDSLTAENKKLTSDFNTATSDLDAARSELEKVKQDLTSMQSEMDKSKQQISDQQTRIEKAAQYADVLNGFFLVDSTYTQHKRRIDKLNDATLADLLDIYDRDVNNNDAWNDYVSYILGTILDYLE